MREIGSPEPWDVVDAITKVRDRQYVTYSQAPGFHTSPIDPDSVGTAQILNDDLATFDHQAAMMPRQP
jgi:hypothetical protein